MSQAGSSVKIGTSRRTTRLVVLGLGIGLYGAVVVVSEPFSGGWLKSCYWSLFTFAPLLANKRFRAAAFGSLGGVSVRVPPPRRSAGAALRTPLDPPVPAEPATAVPAAPVPAAPVPAAPVPASPVPAATVAGASEVLAQVPAEPLASGNEPAGVERAAAAPAAAPTAAHPTAAPPTAAPADGYLTWPPAAPAGVEVGATLGAVAGALRAVMPLDCGLRIDGAEIVVWNSVATLRRSLGEGVEPAAGPAERLHTEVIGLLGSVVGFVARHGIGRWPPAELGAVPRALVTADAVYAWYEEGGRPVVLLDEVALVPGPAADDRPRRPAGPPGPVGAGR